MERLLVRLVRAAGGQCHKWVSPGRRGAPDRIVLLPGARVAFVEVKAPGCVGTDQQRYVQDALGRLGFSVFTVDTPEQCARLVANLTGVAA